jgi:geranylgeranyl pyrophosphate synthase
VTAGLEPLAPVLAELRRHAVASAPPAWPALTPVIDGVLADPLPPHMALPLMATHAAGAPLDRGVPFAVAWTLISAAVRVIDDCGDDDDPRALHHVVGVGRAINYASALLQLSTLVLHAIPAELGRDDLVAEYAAASLQLAAGQDRDLAGGVADRDHYVRIVQDKTCAGYVFAAFGGARIAGAAPEVIEACRKAGYHIGMVLQLLDDLESARMERGDLAQGKRTFPVWQGLARTDHVASHELRALIFDARAAHHAARIRALLDELDVPRAVLAEAARERRLALAALARCPGGNSLLAGYFETIFADTADLAVPRAAPRRGGVPFLQLGAPRRP